MNCEVVAVGTELLLGPSIDTNSTWIGEQLAAHGIDSFFHTVVGDNHGRIVEALTQALDRSDSVIVTGGLGPTQDDITREAIASVMNVDLELHEPSLSRIVAAFAARGVEMAPANERQAWRPVGSETIEQRRGTAPGLICPVQDKVIYALPGVPGEMQEMMERSVLPDLSRRAGETSVIISRFVRTWGAPESTVSEMVSSRIEALDREGNPTLAFLAHGIDGIHIRITARGRDSSEACAMLDAEEAELRAILGPLVFGIDDKTMEGAVGDLLLHRRLFMAVAESLTGGLIASRLVSVPGGSGWFKGGVVSYADEVKHELLKVPSGPVVSPDAARAMAENVKTLLGADIGLGVTGVAGPARQEDQAVGTVFGALALPWGPTELIELHLNGDRQRIRELTCANLLDVVRRRLLTGPS